MGEAPFGWTDPPVEWAGVPLTAPGFPGWGRLRYALIERSAAADRASENVIVTTTAGAANSTSAQSETQSGLPGVVLAMTFAA